MPFRALPGGLFTASQFLTNMFQANAQTPTQLQLWYITAQARKTMQGLMDFWGMNNAMGAMTQNVNALLPDDIVAVVNAGTIPNLVGASRQDVLNALAFLYMWGKIEFYRVDG